MKKSRKEKKLITNIPKKNSTVATNEHKEIAAVDMQLPFVLMPELDELVKKNPNRLIGCGG